MNEETVVNELREIKKLLIIQLIVNGVSIRDIVKITGMSTKTLYGFIPKNINRTKSQE